METRDVIVDGIKIGTLSFPTGTSEAVWANAMSGMIPTPDTDS